PVNTGPVLEAAIIAKPEHRAERGTERVEIACGHRGDALAVAARGQVGTGRRFGHKGHHTPASARADAPGICLFALTRRTRMRPAPTGRVVVTTHGRERTQ